MKRLSATVCAGLLATAVLTGCGDDNGGGDSDSASGGDYCGQVEDFKGEFDVLNGEDSTLDELSGAVDRVGEIKDSAPGDVESSWSALHDAMETMIGGMEDLGIEGDQLLHRAMTKLREAVDA